MDWRIEKHLLRVDVAEKSKVDHSIYHLDLPGYYQTKNLLTVLEAVSQLQQKGWHLQKHLQGALQQVKKMTGFHGRWDVIGTNPLVVLDVAHNEAGVQQVLEQIELTDHHELHIVIGMVNDKEIGHVLSMLPTTANYYFTQAQIPRALNAELLMDKGNEIGLRGKAYAFVNDALHAARVKAKSNDLVIVMGSVFVVGEVEF